MEIVISRFYQLLLCNEPEQVTSLHHLYDKYAMENQVFSMTITYQIIKLITDMCTN